MLRRNIVDHQRHEPQRFSIASQRLPPAWIIHVVQIDLYFFPKGKEICVLLIHVQINAVSKLEHRKLRIADAFISVDGGNRILNQLADAAKGKIERIDRAFQSFEQVDAHQAANSFLAAFLRQTVATIVIELAVFMDSTFKYVFGRGVDFQ